MGLSKSGSRKRIKLGIRRKIRGNSERPRLTVFRSNKAIYCQLIDDIAGRTVASASSQEKGMEGAANKSEQAKKVGGLLAERAKAAKVESVVFDRNGYLYHGRVKALAEGVREGGLTF